MRQVALYSETWQRYQAAMDALAEEGAVIEFESGAQQIHPCMTIVNQCLSQLDKIGKQFGLTPMSRQRIEVQKKSDKKNVFDGI